MYYYAAAVPINHAHYQQDIYILQYVIWYAGFINVLVNIGSIII